MNKFILTYIAVFSLMFANDEALLQSIKDNIHIDRGWDFIEIYDNGISVAVKDIDDIPIKAVMVKRVININPDKIAEVVEDIPNYSKFLKSASAMEANLLSKNDNNILGHQHLKLKYVKDRHYAFSMFRPFESSNRIDWELIPENIFKSIEGSKYVKKNGIYIDIGFGSWLVKQLENGDTEISYRLVMHPGGNIPNFAIDYLNKVAIVALFEEAIEEAVKRSKRGNGKCQI